MVARPFTTATALGMAGHVFFELGAGVGMPGASVLGPVPAAGLTAAATVGALRTSDERLLALGNGVALAASVAHLTAWPRKGPWLADCEGLGPELMPAYNTIIYATAVTALVALATEQRRWWPLAALVAVPVLAKVQHVEHARIRVQARTRPGWWNRRLRPA